MDALSERRVANTNLYEGLTDLNRAVLPLRVLFRALSLLP